MPGTQNDAHINVRLPRDWHDQLKALAGHHGKRVSDEVREAIRLHLLMEASLEREAEGQ